MSVQVVVDNRIRILSKELPKEVQDVLKRKFTHKNPKYALERQFSYYTKEKPEYVTFKTEKDNSGNLWLTFPRGGMSVVREVLSTLGISKTVLDCRNPSPDFVDFPEHKLTLFDYQERLVQAAIKKQNCLIRAGCGAGKTTAVIALAARVRKNTLVIVWSANLLEQWVKRLQKELGLSLDQIGVIGDGKFSIKPITVAMQQTLFSRGISDELNDYFDVLIFDEVQRAAADTMFHTVDPFKANWRIGVSDDEHRKDKKEFLIYDLFGEVVADIPHDDLVKSGHVMGVDVFLTPSVTSFDGFEDMDPKKRFKEFLERATADEPRNQQILDLAHEHYFAGESILIMTHRREHAKYLHERLTAMKLNAGLMLGTKKDAAEFNRTKMGLLSGEIGVGVGTYQAIGQALDVPNLTVGIAATPIITNQQLFRQARGRFCRTSAATEKTYAKMYCIHDPSVFGWKSLKNVIKWNKEVYVEHEGAYMEAREFLKLVE